MTVISVFRVRACVCVCARARACVHACARVCVRVFGVFGAEPWSVEIDSAGRKSVSLGVINQDGLLKSYLKYLVHFQRRFML